MKILSALNAFKGSSCNVVEINEIVLNQLQKQGYLVEAFPIADGGDGTFEVLRSNLKFAESKFSKVLDPLGREINAEWLYVSKKHTSTEKDTAYIVLSKISGLSLLKPEERNPLNTSTFGLGQVTNEAIDLGCEEIYITLGGSATLDLGIGFAKALGLIIKDSKNEDISLGGKSLADVRYIDSQLFQERLKNIKLNFLCDVSTPLRNLKGNDVLFYAKQKFPPSAINMKQSIERLNNGIDNVVSIIDTASKRTISEQPFTGSAGGLPYLSLAFIDARVFSGMNWFVSNFGLEEKIKSVDVVITGEGHLDLQTFEGKAPAKIIEIASKHKKKIVFICGSADNEDWARFGIHNVIKLKAENMSVEDSILNIESLLRKAVSNFL